MKVSQKTIRNFLTVWDNISDTGPSDWEEFIELEGKNQNKEVDKIYDFIHELRKFVHEDCVICGKDVNICGGCSL